MRQKNKSLEIQDKLISIQFLRGIAVILVIFYHYGFMDFGFIGVDLFFAISGYVIINSIYKNQLFLSDEHRSNDARVFFKNRFNRIYPPLLLLIALTSTYSLFQLSLINNTFVNFSKNIFLSSISLSNLYAYQNSTDYFDANNFHKPLLHLWSVSAEFQIYFVFAVLLYLLVKKTRTRFFQTIAIYLLTLISLWITTSVGNSFFSRYGLDYFESFLFYSPLGRLWEFGFGCIVFICSRQLTGGTLSKPLILSPILIILFLALVFGVDLKVLAVLSLLPLLVFGIKQAIFKNMYLKIISSIGNRSYSLYLYHMPAIYFFYYSRENVPNLIISMLLCVALSEISYRRIETLKTVFPNRYFRLYNLILLSLIIFMALSMRLGFPVDVANRLNSNSSLNNSHVSEAGWELPFGNCAGNEILNNICESPESKPTSTIIGDSHAGSFVQVQVADSLSLKFNQSLIAAGCSLFVPGLSDNPDCNQFNVKFKETLNNSSSFEYYLSEDFALYGSLYTTKILRKECTAFDSCAYSGFVDSDYLSKFEIFLNEFLSGNTRKMTIIGASPRLVGWPNQFNFWNNVVLTRSSIDVKSESITAKKINRKLSQLVNRLNLEHSNRIDFINTTDFVCTDYEDRCKVYDGKSGAIYWDADHFSVVGAQLLMDKDSG